MLGAIVAITLSGALLGADEDRPTPLSSNHAAAVAPTAAVCNGLASFCGAVLRIESNSGTIGSVSAGAHYGPAWGIPPTPNDTAGTGWCVDDTHTGFPAGTIVVLPNPGEWRPRDKRVAATLISLYGGDRVLPYQPLAIDADGELTVAHEPAASPTQLRHVAVWLALRSVLPDPAGTPRIDLASARTFADRAGRIPSAIGNAAVPIARRMVAIAAAMTPIGGDPVVTIEAADGELPTGPDSVEEVLVRVTDRAGRPLPHLPVWPDRRTNMRVTPQPPTRSDTTTVTDNASRAGWPSFDTAATRQEVAVTDSEGVARFVVEVDKADRWSASFTTESAPLRLRLFGDDIRAQNNVTLRDHAPRRSSATIDGSALPSVIRVVKTSSDPNFGVAGATFALVDGADLEIGRSTTNAEGTADFRFDGSEHPPPYRLRELVAPTGLVRAEHDIDVTTPDRGISTDADDPTVVRVENHPQLHELVILKRVTGMELVPDDMSGFTFTMSQPGVDSPGVTVTTDADGRTPVQPVAAGTYLVAETGRPDWWPSDQPLPAPLEVAVAIDTNEQIVVEFDNVFPEPVPTTLAAPPPTATATTPPPSTTAAPSTTTIPADRTTVAPSTTVAPTTAPPDTTPPDTTTTVPTSTGTPPTSVAPPSTGTRLPRTGDASWRTWYRTGSLMLLAGSVLYVLPTFGITRRDHSAQRSRRGRTRHAGRIATRYPEGRDRPDEHGRGREPHPTDGPDA